MAGVVQGGAAARTSFGGHSQMGPGGNARSNLSGVTPGGFGGGGGGTTNTAAMTRTGAAGAPGVVVVELIF
jgi:hypothetical protein